MILRSFRRLFRRITPVLRDPRGATAVEYGLIVALIVIVMVVALKQVANANTDMWRNVSDKIAAAG
jgi:pilus assembly protein Flp/PilA